MQTRSRAATTTLVQITQVLKPKKAASTRIQKTVKKTLSTKVNGSSTTPVIEDGHPLEVVLLVAPTESPASSSGL